MEFKPRELNSDELYILKTLKSQAEWKGSGKRIYYGFFLPIFIGILFAFLTITTENSFFVYISAISFAIAVVVPYDLYKVHKNKLQRLNKFIEKRTVETCRIQTTRIAISVDDGEEDGRSIIEIGKDTVLYLYEIDDFASKNFPCLQFEIYEKNFFELTDRMINPLSERVNPIIIDSKKTWNYILESETIEQLLGAPEDVSTENRSFNEVLKKIEMQQ